MKHDDPNSKGSYTYSDAMNDWAAEQDTFLRRAKAGILHPSAASSGFYRFLGYFWRLAAILVVAALVAYVGLRRYLKTEDFATTIATQAAALLGADAASLRPFAWKGTTGTSPEFNATGGPGTFFSDLSGSHLQFERPFLGLFSPAWELGDIRIDRLQLNLRSGGLGAVPDLPSTSIDDLPEFPSDFVEPDTSIDVNPDKPDTPDGDDPFGLDLRLKSGGFGIEPDFSQLSFGTLFISRLSTTWGLTPFTRGGLADASSTLRSTPGGGWVVTAESGTLSQRWLRDLELTSPLEVTVAPGSLTFAPCELAFPGGRGTAKIAGRVQTGDIPTLDFDLALRGVPTTSLLGATSRPSAIFAGTLDATGKIGGSTNTATGVTLSLDASIKNGHLTDLPLLEVLALPTAHSAFRHLPVSGTFKLVTSGSTTTVTGLDLASGDRVRLRGTFTVTDHDHDPPPENHPEGIPYVPPTPSYKGTLQLGLAADLLAKHPAARDAHFKPADGFLWIDVPLDGSIASLTKEQSEQLFKAFRPSR